MKVNFVYNKIPHHAGHSGYDQIARYISRQIPVNTIEADVPGFVPWRVWSWLAGRSDWIAARSGMDWYDIWGLNLEIQTAKKLLTGNGDGNVYHFLYGENSYRHLGALTPIAKRKGNRIVCTYHQPPNTFERVVRYTGMLHKLDALIAVSSDQADYFSSLLGKEKVFMIPHGVDTIFFRPAETKRANGKNCVFVGQWLRDFEMLQAVLRRLGEMDPAIRCKIITSEDKAQMFSGLNNVITVSGISDDELLEAYQTADIMVMPLQDCTANNAVLEALACGLPIVTSNVGGISDYVDSACAFMISPGDVEDMSEAIRMLTVNESVRKRMGDQSRLRALNYDWHKVAAKYIDVYQALIN